VLFSSLLFFFHPPRPGSRSTPTPPPALSPSYFLLGGALASMTRSSLFGFAYLEFLSPDCMRFCWHRSERICFYICMPILLMTCTIPFPSLLAGQVVRPLEVPRCHFLSVDNEYPPRAVFLAPMVLYASEPVDNFPVPFLPFYDSFSYHF